MLFIIQQLSRLGLCVNWVLLGCQCCFVFVRYGRCCLLMGRCPSVSEVWCLKSCSSNIGLLSFERLFRFRIGRLLAYIWVRLWEDHWQNCNYLFLLVCLFLRLVGFFIFWVSSFVRWCICLLSLLQLLFACFTAWSIAFVMFVLSCFVYLSISSIVRFLLFGMSMLLSFKCALNLGQSTLL